MLGLMGLFVNLLIYTDYGLEPFFVSFIVTTTFTFLNMFIAVFTNAIASVDIEDGDDVGFSRIINELKTEMAELKSLIVEGFDDQVVQEHSEE